MQLIDFASDFSTIPNGIICAIWSLLGVWLVYGDSPFTLAWLFLQAHSTRDRIIITVSVCGFFFCLCTLPFAWNFTVSCALFGYNFPPRGLPWLMFIASWTIFGSWMASLAWAWLPSWIFMIPPGLVAWDYGRRLSFLSLMDACVTVSWISCGLWMCFGGWMFYGLMVSSLVWVLTLWLPLVPMLKAGFELSVAHYLHRQRRADRKAVWLQKWLRRTVEETWGFLKMEERKIAAGSSDDTTCRLQTLPVELRLLIYSHMHYDSALALERASRHFYNDIPHQAIDVETKTVGVLLAEASQHNKDRLACYYCLRVLPMEAFGSRDWSKGLL
ncbi:uncharacterized protein LTR77_000867 [Saxophila tyrrhenica]|uniref:F-box domain-containing protein n=1 Tax=Saxophila tyrrhenica TaxID=1690608 RepID=A0AAV9PR56_9PEZI|nr:hypothetical protein LTR77_000867 [Saxophila tyrrhenica]